MAPLLEQLIVGNSRRLIILNRTSRVEGKRGCAGEDPEGCGLRCPIEVAEGACEAVEVVLGAVVVPVNEIVQGAGRGF